MTSTELSTDTLSDRDRAMIAGLASGKTPTEAAAELGISAPTVYRRLSDPAFTAQLAVAKATAWAPEASELRREFRRSVAHMVTVRDNPDVHDGTRLRAAQAICDLALRVAESTDRDVRLAALELFVSELRGNPR
jgi:hypothetical protein